MLHLPEVTLVCVDTANHALALRAVARSCTGVRFARALFLTDAVPPGTEVPAGVDVVPIAPLRSRDDYSRFVLSALAPHVDTTHALLVQWDGYVVNPDAWDRAFLDCDYLGAVWFWRDDDLRVGNGGFSLRSRRLLAATRDAHIEAGEAEDVAICRTCRPRLEREFGIRFGTETLAERFSFETDYPAGRPFGFHGLFNFWRTVPPDELRTLPACFSDAIARSPQFDQLMHNCLLAGMWAQGAAVGRRILAADAANDDVRAIVADAEAQAERLRHTPPDAPCPCGSARPYDRCHGAPGAPSILDLPPRERTADEFAQRGQREHRAGALVAADREYRAALRLAPAHQRALHGRGLVAWQRGRIGDAVALLERAAAVAPASAEIRQDLERVRAAAAGNSVA